MAGIADCFDRPGLGLILGCVRAHADFVCRDDGEAAPKDVERTENLEGESVRRDHGVLQPSPHLKTLVAQHFLLLGGQTIPLGFCLFPDRRGVIRLARRLLQSLAGRPANRSPALDHFLSDLVGETRDDGLVVLG